MKSVFLCHSSADKAIVRKVASRIEAAGISVWLDESEIKFGENFVLKIAEGLSGSDYILIFLSKAFLCSKWAHQEWSVVFNEEIATGISRIIPILIEDLPDRLPSSVALLRSRRYVDLRDADQLSAIDTLIEHMNLRPHQEHLNAGTVKDLCLPEMLVYLTKMADGSTLVTYQIGQDTCDTQVYLPDVMRLSGFDDDYFRIRHRFGGAATAKLEDTAARASLFFLPPKARAYLDDGKVRRLRVIANGSDPRLPWEALHTGRSFVALGIPILTTPSSLADKHASLLEPQTVVLVEAVPAVAGIQLDVTG